MKRKRKNNALMAPQPISMPVGLNYFTDAYECVRACEAGDQQALAALLDAMTPEHRMPVFLTTLYWLAQLIAASDNREQVWKHLHDDVIESAASVN